MVVGVVISDRVAVLWRDVDVGWRWRRDIDIQVYRWVIENPLR